MGADSSIKIVSILKSVRRPTDFHLSDVYQLKYMMPKGEGFSSNGESYVTG